MTAFCSFQASLKHFQAPRQHGRIFRRRPLGGPRLWPVSTLPRRGSRIFSGLLWPCGDADSAPRWSLVQMARLDLFPSWKWSLLQADLWAAQVATFAKVSRETVAEAVGCAAAPKFHRLLRQVVHGDHCPEVVAHTASVRVSDLRDLSLHHNRHIGNLADVQKLRNLTCMVTWMINGLFVFTLREERVLRRDLRHWRTCMMTGTSTTLPTNCTGGTST